MIKMKQMFLFHFILILQLNTLIAQSNQRCYGYDAAGNRTLRSCSFFRIVDTDTQETGKLSHENVEYRAKLDDKNLQAAIIPNPASGEIEISAKGFGPGATWNIMTRDGKTILTGPLIYGQKVDVSYMLEGQYFIQIHEGSAILTKSFIITGH